MALASLFLLFTFLSFLALVIGFVNPQVISNITRRTLSRKEITLRFSLVMMASFILAVVFTPIDQDSEQDVKLTDEPRTEGSVSSIASTVSEEEFAKITDAEEAENSTEQITEQALAVDEEEADYATNIYPVKQIIDGDTIDIEVNGNITRIRMIGLDSPETDQCYFQDAKNKIASLLSSAPVVLEYDPSQGEKDRYGRTLAYVFLQDGTNVQEIMIRQGFAKEYTYNTAYKYQTLFKEAQEQAKSKGLGIWGSACAAPAQSVAAIPEEKEAATTPPPAAPDLAAYNCSANVYNCPDFSSHQEAQGVYEYCLKQRGYDVHALDRDKDGLACESL